MRPLMVSQYRQLFFREKEYFPLIQSAELRVHVEVVLVQGLETRVQETREGGVGGLFDDFGTGFAGVVFGACCAETEDVHGVLRG